MMLIQDCGLYVKLLLKWKRWSFLTVDGERVSKMEIINLLLLDFFLIPKLIYVSPKSHGDPNVTDEVDLSALWCSVYKTVGIQCYSLFKNKKNKTISHQIYQGFFLYCNLVFFSGNNVSTHFWSKFNHLFTARPSLLIRSFLSFFSFFFPKRNFPYTVLCWTLLLFWQTYFQRASLPLQQLTDIFAVQTINTFLFSLSYFCPLTVFQF